MSGGQAPGSAATPQCPQKLEESVHSSSSSDMFSQAFSGSAAVAMSFQNAASMTFDEDDYLLDEYLLSFPDLEMSDEAAADAATTGAEVRSLIRCGPREPSRFSRAPAATRRSPTRRWSWRNTSPRRACSRSCPS